ncbi:uncharacterized protein M421DRAFT_432 [Didymella exigua CBS 183.55]|uniref:Uncharacterized protein n=1 Tax=Didymella exigua CBS 183.55 TaxID=1150837 RepID=A0A6A5S717_9PLEO|nr:uncharacterized protein M421DRAFT_432 [Didymella exigua CBS 183.55]KAF1934296.1 hypothetical protein M421DRAFT_432 [Didymella exigua CBS 183.55]
MLLEQNACACGTNPRSRKSAKIVYIVTDTRYTTAADFDEGKGTTLLDSVHTTPRAANVRARKVMYARTSPGFEIDEDKIIDEVKNGLYTGIGVGGAEKDGCYARNKQLGQLAYERRKTSDIASTRGRADEGQGG